MSTDYSNYYYILFSANPHREVVRLHIDGDKCATIMSYAAFLDLIVTTTNWGMEAPVKTALASHGSYYLLDRANLDIRLLSQTKGDPIIKTRDLANAAKEELDPERQRRLMANTLNPADHLYNAELRHPALSNIGDNFHKNRRNNFLTRGVSVLFKK